MKTDLTRILLFEDNPCDARLIREIVMEAEGGGFDLEVADHLATGLEHLKPISRDVILLDIGRPDTQGFEALTKVCANAMGVPVVVLTGLDDESFGIEALRRGAYDYVAKEQILRNGRALRRVLHYAAERRRMEMQKEALEAELRREKENFQRSLDDLPLGMRIVSMEGDTLYANRAILRMYNYRSIEELKNESIEKRYTSESYIEFQKRKKIRQSGEFGPSEYEINIVRKDGEVRHLCVFRKHILWNDEKQFQMLYLDVTEEKKRGEVLKKFETTIKGQKRLLERQHSSVEELIDRLTHSREELAASFETLKANKDDLVRSEKLAFTGRMAAGIAHEIRNPLTNIILSLRQLRKDEKIKQEGFPYAEIIERNSNRIEFLVAELLNCARPIKLNLQPWDIHRIIKDVVNVLKVKLKTQKIRVTKNLIRQPTILLADKEYLGRVFLNIIGNSIDAMSYGGALSIETKLEKSKILIRIQDNGIGISEKNLIKIFDPFFSTKKGGVGLGLSTCQNIVTSHGGLIEVESAWRKGTAFTVSLPLEPKLSGCREDILEEALRGPD
jgi:PAS domain S-box-containing protein